MRYSFCESVHASSMSPWHIRQLVDCKKLGGGIDSSSLCGFVKSGWGWDLEVEITKHHLSHACPRCVAVYHKVKRNKENP